MRQFHLLSLLVAVCLFATCRNSHAALTIADSGKSTFIIVVPDRAPASVNNAATELRTDIQLATKAKLSIQKDNEKVKTPFISLGATQQAKAAGITAEGIAPDGFRIVTKDGNLFIIGLDTAAKVDISRWNDYKKITPQPDIAGPQYTEDGGWSNGTANGVYTFLEDYLDVQWLMPGKLGLDVPSKSTFTIADIDRTEQPEFIYRSLPYLEEYLNPKPAVHAWENHQKLGASFNVNHKHNWTKTVPASLYKEHPDWFAMIDGKRKKPTGRYKLETTNPQLVEYYADQAIKALKKDPAMNTYSLSPSDSRGYSESPESKALYDPSPSEVLDQESVPGAPSITPLMLKFYRDVSNIVKEKYPQGKLAGYLYQDYIFPPLKGDMTLPDNFIPVIAPSFDYGYHLYRDDTRKKFDYVMDAWGKIAPPIWFYYDIPNTVSDSSEAGMILPPATGILNHVFASLTKNHIKGAYFYGNMSWTGSAITNYIDAKLLWNPRLDANDLQRKWLERAYGPQAGLIMEQFYQKLDGWFAEGYRKNSTLGYSVQETIFKEIYAPHYAEMEALFLKAKSQPMSEMQKKRLQLFESEMIVLQWRLRNAGYIDETFKSPLQHDGAYIADLMFDQNKPAENNTRMTDDNAFTLFPLFWYQDQATEDRKAVNVQLNQALPPNAKNQKLNSGYILIYTKEAGTVKIKADSVDSGSAFAGYRVYEPAAKDSNKLAVIHQGLLYAGATIEFDAKADSLYWLRLSAHGLKTTNLGYSVSIPGAAPATGKFANDTLYLQSKQDSPLYVFISKGAGLSSQSNAKTVTISTQTPQDAARNTALRQLPGSKVLLPLDKQWRFATDEKGTGISQGFQKADFNDASWSNIDATDSWQTQGFPNYHGTAWYRKNITLTNVPADEKVLLFFGAVDGDAVVYVNDQKAGEHSIGKNGERWNEPFSIDVSSLLSKENVIAVQVTKHEKASGMYKGVALLTTKK